MATRAERLMANAPEDMDAIVIANGGENFIDSMYKYLLNPKGGVFEDCYMVVRKDGTQDVIVNILEEEAARSGTGNVRVFHDRAELEAIFKDCLGDCRKVGFNVDSVPYSTVTGIKKLSGNDFEVADARKAIADTVAVKDADEIAAIQKACDISSALRRAVLMFVIPFFFMLHAAICAGTRATSVASAFLNRSARQTVKVPLPQ